MPKLSGGLPLAKYVSTRQSFISPSIAIWDKPKFGFPSQVRTSQFQSVNCDDRFLTCLAVKTRGAFYALYSIVWRYRCSKTGAGRPTGTISVVGTGPLLAPYSMPPNIQLTGAQRIALSR